MTSKLPTEYSFVYASLDGCLRRHHYSRGFYAFGWKAHTEQVDSTNELFSNILTWARSESGLLEFSPKTLNLHDIADGVMRMMRGVAEEKGIAIDNAILPNHNVWADPYMLNTIMRNLIGNGIKYTENGGKITIAAIADGEFVKVDVSDIGVGMSEEQAKVIFDSVINSSTHGTSGEQGTGIRLAQQRASGNTRRADCSKKRG